MRPLRFPTYTSTWRPRASSTRFACPPIRFSRRRSRRSSRAPSVAHRTTSRRFYASFRYLAQSWSRSRRVVAKVEWYPGELLPRVGFIVTNLRRPARKVVAFYNGRGTAEQWIKEGKHAIKWTRLSCTTFRANAVRLQLHALAYNLANLLRTLALPGEVERWSLTTLREKVVKIGAKVIGHGRYAIFQMAEVAVPCELFGRILERIARLRPDPVPC
jgi:Transposase DDE domain group 1